MSRQNDGVAGKMGGARERGRAAGRLVLPCGLFRDHAAARRDRVQAGRHGDAAERHLPGRAPLGHRGEVDRARATTSRAAARCASPTSGPPRTSTPTCTHVVELDPSPANRAAIDRLLGLSTKYKAAAKDLFVAIDRGDATAVQRLDHEVIDPIFGVLEYMIHLQAQAASARALEHSASLREHEAHATRAITVAFGVGLVLLACFALVIVRIRRAEVARLAQIAISDPLTGLRNHRAFQEDLARELQRVSRSGDPLSLVLLDLDGLKARQRPLRPPGRRRAPAGRRRGDPRRHSARATSRYRDRRRRVRRHPRRLPRPRGARVRPARARARRGHRRHRRGDRAARPRRGDPRGRPRADRRQAPAPARRDLRPGPRDHAPPTHEHDERPLASALALRRRRQGLLHPQPLPDGLAAVRGDRRRARARPRARRPRPARRPAARRRQDRRAGRDPQQARRAHRRRVRADEAPLAARRRHRRGRRHARGVALGAPPPRALRRHRLPRRPGRRRDPARVADHPRRRRVRGDDLGPPVPRRAGSGVRASRS